MKKSVKAKYRIDGKFLGSIDIDVNWKDSSKVAKKLVETHHNMQEGTFLVEIRLIESGETCAWSIKNTVSCFYIKERKLFKLKQTGKKINL